MPTLYVTERQATVRLAGRALEVTVRPDDPGAGPVVRLKAELHRLELVALVGPVHITRDALLACVDEGIGLAWFDAGGRFRARLVPEAPRAAGYRLRQYEAWHDPQTRLARARAVVASKAAGARAVLLGLQSNDDAPALAAGLAALNGLRGRVDACPDVASLRGLEGACAAAYFGALAAAFKADIGFPGRRRRPPPDPANALLSLGYVLLGQRLAGLLEARGLDPDFGFFHGPRPGRPSLALDLLEELRHPVVDRFVLRGCNLRVFRPRHFEPDAARPGGVRLTAEGWKLFLARWEEHLLRPLRERDGGEAAVVPVLVRQVDRLAADLRGGPPYEPYRPYLARD
jgi:CRISPR-associated protein Cas1